MKKYCHVLVLFTCIFLASRAFASENNRLPAVGQVVFSLGKVELINRSGDEQRVQRGTTIYEGDKIVTGEAGKVGLRMIDGAIEKVGKNSVFSIIEYQYDQQFPQNSEIKIELEKGVLFSKTGKAGEAAKEKYRLNTPIAAIGIRGTEYTVFTDQQTTSVKVHIGGVIMSSFNSVCKREGFGSCVGENVMMLMADQKQKALLLELGQKRPVIVPSSRIEHDLATTGKGSPVSELKGTTGTSANDTLVAKKMPSVTWGRWNPEIDGASLDEQLANGYELISQSGDFAIIRRENESLILPSEGEHNFTAQSYGVTIRNSENDTFKSAEIENPSLSINFAEKTFTTGFMLNSGSLKSNVEASGNLDEAGIFVDNGARPETKIKGVTGGEGANQAAYTFFHQIDTNNAAAGAIDWSAD